MIWLNEDRKCARIPTIDSFNSKLASSSMNSQKLLFLKMTPWSGCKNAVSTCLHFRLTIKPCTVWFGVSTNWSITSNVAIKRDWISAFDNAWYIFKFSPKIKTMWFLLENDLNQGHENLIRFFSKYFKYRIKQCFFLPFSIFKNTQKFRNMLKYLLSRQSRVNYLAT